MMSESEDKQSIMIRCSEEFWRYVKLAAVFGDVAQRELCEDALVKFHERRKAGDWNREDYIAKPKEGEQKSVHCSRSVVEKVGRWGEVDNVEKTTVWYSAVREHVAGILSEQNMEAPEWVS